MTVPASSLAFLTAGMGHRRYFLRHQLLLALIFASASSIFAQQRRPFEPPPQPGDGSPSTNNSGADADIDGAIEKIVANPPRPPGPDVITEASLEAWRKNNPYKPTYDALREQFHAARHEVVAKLEAVMEAQLKTGSGLASDPAAKAKFDDTVTPIAREYKAKIKPILNSKEANAPHLDDISIAMAEIGDAPSVLNTLRKHLVVKGYPTNRIEELLQAAKPKLTPVVGSDGKKVTVRE